MMYPEGLFLICSTGAFLAQRQCRWWVASWLAAIATLARPNGLVVSLALAAEALITGSGSRRVLGLLAPRLLGFSAAALALHTIQVGVLQRWIP